MTNVCWFCKHSKLFGQVGNNVLLKGKDVFSLLLNAYIYSQPSIFMGSAFRDSTKDQKYWGGETVFVLNMYRLVFFSPLSLSLYQ